MIGYEYEIQRIVTFIILTIIGIYLTTKFGKRSIKNQSETNLETMEKSDKLSLVEFLATPNPVPKKDNNNPDFDSLRNRYLNIFNKKYTICKELIKTKYQFSNNELELLALPENYEKGRTGAHYLAGFGYCFSIDELLQINNPADTSGTTPAHFMASNKYNFSVDDLITLQNPLNNQGESVAGLMILGGVKFSNEEILSILKCSQTNIYQEARQIQDLGISLQNDELLESLCFSTSIANIMVLNGRKFTINEINLLGNPMTDMGLSLADNLKLQGENFADEESERLGVNWKTIQFSGYSVNLRKIYKRVNHQKCIVCGNKLLIKDKEESKALKTIIDRSAMPYEMQSKVWFCPRCNWWYTIESVLDIEFDIPPYTFIVSGNILEKSTQEEVSPHPWEDILSNPDLYIDENTVFGEIDPSWENK